MRNSPDRFALSALVAAFFLVVGGCAESGVSDPRNPGGGDGDAGDVLPDGQAADADGTDAEDAGDVGDAGDAGEDADGGTIDIGPSDTAMDTDDSECQTDDDCPAPMGAEGTCNEFGRCVTGCKDGYVDLDGDFESNGCECQRTNMGTELCDGKDNDCDGEVDEDFDTSSDPMNCGMCGNTCQFDNAMAGCKMGQCVLTGCKMGFKDCDGNPANGCEVDISSSTDHCGKCGNACQLAGATATCAMGACEIASCDKDRADCNTDPSDGCEVNLLDTADHCGKCGNACGDAHTTNAGCRTGACFIGGCEKGWDNCDGNLSNGCEQDILSSNSNCGACGNICQIPNAQNVCKKGACKKERCNMGWHDLNGKISDGCEYSCTYISADDVPDAKGMDENCDGLDGVRKESVFVALSTNGGNNGNTGRSTNSPVATISKGIDIASKCSPKCDVLVSAGTYNEQVKLKPNVDVYGGYSGKDWDRDVSSNKTVVKGPNNRTVIATDIFNPTEFDGFTVQGKNYSGNGQSTYAIWVKNSLGKNLKFDNVRVEAGNGGDGSDGADGSNGPGGGDGARASGSSGGAGGSSACGADGGNGGRTWSCGSSDGQDGRNGGDGTGVGRGGSAGREECGDSCNDGAGHATSGGNGSIGSNGAGGSGATQNKGNFQRSGLWTGDMGTSGKRGRNGGGGGGGGAGGTDNDDYTNFFGVDPCPGEMHKGGGGGGGGAGGCGGKAGQPGKPGGGSFAVVLIKSDIRFVNSTLVLGNGGNGGAGGDGGNGGRGGNGRAGVNRSGDEAGDGGSGGDGGHGGGGGGGAGACGGPAVGIAMVNGASAMRQNLSFNGGQPGSGGDGGRGGYRGDQANRAKDGADGCTGIKSNVEKY